MMMRMSHVENGVDLVIHAAGVLDRYLSVSYEKLMLDFEILRYVKRCFAEFDLDDNTLPLDLIDEIGHEGAFLTTDHTFAYCRKEPLLRSICSCGKVEAPGRQLERNMEKEYHRLMAPYVQPEIPSLKRSSIKEILAAAGANLQLLDGIEKM